MLAYSKEEEEVLMNPEWELADNEEVQVIEVVDVDPCWEESLKVYM